MAAVWTMFTETRFLEIPLARWLLAMLVVFATFVAQRALTSVLHALAQRLAARTETKLDDVMLEAAEKPAGWLVVIVGVMLAVHLLAPPKASFPLVGLVDQAAKVLSLLVASWFGWRLIDGLAAYFAARAARTESKLDDQLIPFIAKTLKVFLVITAVLVIAQNMGYSISGLVASLGIGGLAVAMAAKDTIANVFGSIMILLDRPFKVGDTIRTSEFQGTVEEIGLRSTRIRTFEKTLVNIPNAQLANMVIDNVSMRPIRRVDMRVGLTYDTTPEQIQQAIAGIERILRAHEGVDQDSWVVRFEAFADSSLSILIVYYTKSTDWAEHLKVREEINLEIMRLLERLGLEFAFPTRTVYLKQES